MIRAALCISIISDALGIQWGLWRSGDLQDGNKWSGQANEDSDAGSVITLPSTSQERNTDDRQYRPEESFATLKNKTSIGLQVVLNGQYALNHSEKEQHSTNSFSEQPGATTNGISLVSPIIRSSYTRNNIPKDGTMKLGLCRKDRCYQR